MLTADGPRLVEYNCRFGDPEAQAVLPLLDGDLAELALAAPRRRARRDPSPCVRGAACTVVAAAAGYPERATHSATPSTLPTTSTSTERCRVPRRR